MVSFDDGSGPALIVGGQFTTAGGVQARRLARWDGTSWSEFGGGASSLVGALRVFDDGSGPALYACGAFYAIGGVSCSGVARWTGTTWVPLSSGVSNAVYSAAALERPNGSRSLFLGGAFTVAGGTTSHYVAEWTAACPCPPSAYCSSGTSSNGCTPTLSSSGAPSASLSSPFTVTASGVDGQKTGLIFYGISGPTVAPWGSSTSTLCVKPPQQRTTQVSSGGTSGACDGVLALDWNGWHAAHPGALGSPIGAGTTLWLQGWYRDPPSSKTTALTSALEAFVAP
jgi:hypothetical protein